MINIHRLLDAISEITKETEARQNGGEKHSSHRVTGILSGILSPYQPAPHFLRCPRITEMLNTTCFLTFPWIS